MEVREATDSDREAWNRVAEKSNHSTYAHTWEWMRTIEKGLGLKSIKLILEHKGNPVGIYSGFLNKPRTSNFLVKGRPVLYSPITTTWDYGGPCFLEEPTRQMVREIVLGMQKQAKARKAVSIRTSPFISFGHFDILNELGYRKSPRQTVLMDLTPTEEELWMALNKKTRNQIRQSERNGLEVIEVNDIKPLYDCLKDTAQRTGMELPPILLFQEIKSNLVPRKMAKFHVVKSKGQAIGASLCFYYKKYMVTRYYTAYSDHLRLRPYHALIWNAIKDGKENGIETFDMGGIPLDPDNGVRKFKLGWSKDIVDVDWYIKDIYLSSLRSLKRRIS